MLVPPAGLGENGLVSGLHQGHAFSPRKQARGDTSTSSFYFARVGVAAGRESVG